MKFFHKYLCPRSKNDDDSRREYILNVLLAGFFLLALVSFLFALMNFISSPDSYRGVNVFFDFIVLSIVAGLYILSRKSHFIISSYILIGLVFLMTFYTSYNWGVELPVAIILYSLIILVSGILVSIRFSYFITSLVSIIYIAMGHMEVTGRIQPNLYWKQETITVKDPIFLVVMFWIIQILTWLSFHQIEKSLSRARKSEAQLRKERDLLEIRVEERTSELRKAQMEKVSQLAHLAEFGKIASSIVHDISNPLTAILLNLEEVNNSKKSTQANIKQALVSSRKLEQFVGLVKKQLQKQEIIRRFDVKNEISEVLKVLNHKLKVNQVKVILNTSLKYVIEGNPIKFSQLISNLISNAIDAYDSNRSIEKIISISLESKKGLLIKIADHGSGIPSADLPHIFDPFYTTKSPEKGTGIGLSIAKEIVEDDFKGKITIKSEELKGTIVEINIPNKCLV